MKKRYLREIKVSEIGMGCMGFSHGYGKVPDEKYSIEAIQNAYQNGCTFFDTAESYGREQFYPGHNEILVGKAVKDFRNDIVLATKMHLHDYELNQNKNLYDIMSSHLNKSLSNLQSNYIDLYYLHRINENISIEDIAKVMGNFIKEGKIRGWGLSQVSVETISKAHEITPLSAVQNIYSMMERDCENNVIPYCLEHNIGFVPFSPIASGFLSGNVTKSTRFEGDDVRKYVPQLSQENIEANQPILDLIRTYAKRKHATNAQISLAWMLYKYPNLVPIPGSKNKGRIIENINSSDVQLTENEFQELEKELSKIVIHGHRGYVESEHQSFSHHWIKS